MDELALRAALAVVAVALPAWVVLGATVVLGRARYDRTRRDPRSTVLGEREAQRLVRRVSRLPRTDWGRWRGISALSRLTRAQHRSAPRLLRRSLANPDMRTATAAIRALGEVGDAWAIDLLVSALREGHAPRSRIAAELEHLAPAPGTQLLPLLHDRDPAVRFWGATLLAPYPELGETSLIALTWDPDPNVRAAAIETLGSRSGHAVAAATLALLDDPLWFVRVHAARSAGSVIGAAAASTIAPLLSDRQWWVRAAAKDALRGMGADAVSELVSMLAHPDPFARNGAAEVLQDIGFVDALALESPGSPLLERIYAAGGERLREAAELRTAGKKRPRKARAA